MICKKGNVIKFQVRICTMDLQYVKAKNVHTSQRWLCFDDNGKALQMMTMALVYLGLYYVQMYDQHSNLICFSKSCFQTFCLNIKSQTNPHLSCVCTHANIIKLWILSVPCCIPQLSL